MAAAITGDSNTAVGASAMVVATGAMARNTALGMNAFANLNNANADDNVAIG